MINLKDIEKKNNFKVPDNYFDNFEDNFNDYLNIRVDRKGKVTLFQKIKPYIYVAACFVAMYFVGNFILENALKYYNNSHQKSVEIADDNTDFNFEQYYYYKILEDYDYYDIFTKLPKTNNDSETISEYLSQTYSDYELLIE